MMDHNDTIITGRKRIAEMLGRSERAVSPWIKRGVLPVTKDGPFDNSLLRVRVADLKRLRGDGAADAAVSG